MKRDNIVLIGMPGAGKSTLGVLVAKALNYRFLDTDLRIQEYTGQLLYETIRDKGMEEFLKIEENVLLQIVLAPLLQRAAVRYMGKRR